MLRKWKFLAVIVTNVVAGSIAFTGLAAGSSTATKVRVRLAPGGEMLRPIPERGRGALGPATARR